MTTKEEIIKEAHEQVNYCTPLYYECFIQGYIASAEPREKQIEELEQKLNKYKHDCPNCSAFGKHCPHKVNGDPYTYDCYLTVADLEKENAELKESIKTLTIHDTNAVLSGLEMKVLKESHRDRANKTQEQLTKAKKIIKTLLRLWNDVMTEETVKALIAEAEQFLSEVEK